MDIKTENCKTRTWYKSTSQDEDECSERFTNDLSRRQCRAPVLFWTSPLIRFKLYCQRGLGTAAPIHHWHFTATYPMSPRFSVLLPLYCASVELSMPCRLFFFIFSLFLVRGSHPTYSRPWRTDGHIQRTFKAFVERCWLYRYDIGVLLLIEI